MTDTESRLYRRWSFGMDLVPWERGGLLVAASEYAVCAASGAAVGSIHGRVLLQLLKRRISSGAVA